MLERFLVWLFNRLLGRKYWLFPYAKNMGDILRDAFKECLAAFDEPALFAAMVPNIRIGACGSCAETFKGPICGYQGDRTSCNLTEAECWTPGRFRACSEFVKADQHP